MQIRLDAGAEALSAPSYPRLSPITFAHPSYLPHFSRAAPDVLDFAIFATATLFKSLRWLRLYLDFAFVSQADKLSVSKELFAVCKFL